ncbi:MAG: hypothetical protein V4474_01100 [Patescibacteria group bacterium]
MRKILVFFDKLEDWVRAGLSRSPIAYALIGAVGVILIWKGVEETAGLFPFLYGPGSFVLGVAILLLSGLLVSFFIGDSIIMSGLRREKKLAEKTEKEVETEQLETKEILTELKHIEQELHEIQRP